MSTFTPSYARVVSRGYASRYAEPRPSGAEVWYYPMGGTYLRLFVWHGRREAVLA